MVRAGLPLAAALALSGCAAVGLHHPARALEAGATEALVTFDLIRFGASQPPEGRPPDALEAWLPLPGLQIRHGVGGGAEVGAYLHPGGARAFGRWQFLGDASSRAAASVEAGLTAAGVLASAESERNFSVALMPDFAVASGWRLGERGEGWAALRYLWLRQQIAGRAIEHAAGLTAGASWRAAPLALGAEATALLSPGRSGWVLAPGLDFGWSSR